MDKKSETDADENQLLSPFKIEENELDQEALDLFDNFTKDDDFVERMSEALQNFTEEVSQNMSKLQNKLMLLMIRYIKHIKSNKLSKSAGLRIKDSVIQDDVARFVNMLLAHIAYLHKHRQENEIQYIKSIEKFQKMVKEFSIYQTHKILSHSKDPQSKAFTDKLASSQKSSIQKY